MWVGIPREDEQGVFTHSDGQLRTSLPMEVRYLSILKNSWGGFFVFSVETRIEMLGASGTVKAHVGTY